ncbi:alpha/beta hydrolase [Gracilibacillus sp. YIM 98692]|uniref:alpha/beta hydrolase n=1 Tax=Gracilibacillus sp. YIM 98692 TaxID=2663532 RepID=UPI0013D587A9|nr:alpha/beta hydrolase [Gracilibacillus sp. YIM 98692]
MNIISKEELYNHDDLHQDCPSITPFLLHNKHAPMVIVIPGGGYSHRAYHEGEPIAQWLNDNGYHACVLRYRVAPIEKQEPIYNGKEAIRYVRYHAENWNIPTNKIGVLGFSAGGHLAATISNKFDEGDKDANDPVRRCSSRPDFHILCYPVITMGEHTHNGSKQLLIGENPDEALMNQFSCEKLVTSNTPPAFIWTTANDQSVPVWNSLLYAQALQYHNIPYDLHVFQDGRHGLGLADEHRHTKKWKDACLSWLQHHIT